MKEASKITQPYKLCPQCRTHTEMNATHCPDCNWQFRVAAPNPPAALFVMHPRNEIPWSCALFGSIFIAFWGYVIIGAITMSPLNGRWLNSYQDSLTIEGNNITASFPSIHEYY